MKKTKEKQAKIAEVASISFEFLDFMTGEITMQMNSSIHNSGDWGETQMRKDLNGYMIRLFYIKKSSKNLLKSSLL